MAENKVLERPMINWRATLNELEDGSKIIGGISSIWVGLYIASEYGELVLALFPILAGFIAAIDGFKEK